ncbi:TadE/TadG family type IV pilus assembly protein [Aquibium microcysteis]|uniref:TadE/TadG family type IV pilus assembly protein n=1 Tax=Aquibium microcysteis TaxID=675281 RepID=UPI001EF3717C|nr:TadE/TadG family type IV pilus assembly protein [Aquibium microcysteis]
MNRWISFRRTRSGSAGCQRRLVRFARDENGALAIEFVALALPFSMLVFAILESSVSFAGQQVLVNAADNIARQFRTGQLKPADVDEAKLKTLICAELKIIVASGCPGLEVDLRQFDTFEEAAQLRIKYTDGGDIDTSDFTVDPGPSLSKNTLRIFYRWPVMTDVMRKSMSNIGDGYTLQFATVTWQNEPFDD